MCPQPAARLPLDRHPTQRLRAQQVLDASERRVALACMDHIGSAPGVLMPLGAMVAACAQRSVPVFVDAAHSLGQVRRTRKMRSDAVSVGRISAW